MSFKILNAQLVSESEHLFDLAKQKAQKEVSNGETDSKKQLVGRIYLKVVEARNLAIGDVLTSSSDPYVTIELGSSSHNATSDAKKLKTSIKKRTLDPIWNEEFSIDVFEDIHIHHLKFEIYDEDTLKKDDFLGYCIIQFGDVKFNELEDKWYPVRPRKWNEKVSGDIHVQYRYIPEKIEQQKHVNIRHLLKDKFTRTYFLQFLHLDYSEENLLFYLQVEEFKERVALEYTGKEEKHSKLMRLKKTRSMLSPEAVQRGESTIPKDEISQSVFLKLYNEAKRIYTLFIKPDAEQEVNLDYEVKEFYIELFEGEKGEAKRIETFRETYSTREQLMTFFELPQISAYNIIETDCFPRFVKSTYYQRLLQSIEWVRRFLDFQSEQQIEALNRLSMILGPKEFGEMRKFMNKRISSDKKLKASMGIEGGVDGKFIKSEHHEHQTSSEEEDEHSDVEEPASDDEITAPPPKIFSMTPIQPLSGSSSSLSLKGEESESATSIARKKLTRKQKQQIVEGVYRPSSFRT